MKNTVISALITFTAIAGLASCSGSIPAEKSAFIGEWNLESINFPLYENDYKARLHANDTMKSLDPGKAAFWGTANVDSIKAMELKLIEEEHETMMAQFKKFQFRFVSDSLVFRTMNHYVDSMRWDITPNQELVLKSLLVEHKRPDTLHISFFDGKEVRFVEKFLNTEIKSTYLKK